MDGCALNDADRAELLRLEEAMWRPETRFDMHFQQRYFAPDFVEFGRSGRVYTREQAILRLPARPIRCQWPLRQLVLRPLAADCVQIIYDSWVINEAGALECAHRASLWSRGPQGWVMRFHQATPFVHGQEMP
ncbi:nuclear transport factor 2 family protein [Comamonadaceae bacterium OH2545_COT-014]|nr:nuclear transport factor 2 family protein [Comamonadaceae bacterium OH2545_COT-014]